MADFREDIFTEPADVDPRYARQSWPAAAAGGGIARAKDVNRDLNRLPRVAEPVPNPPARILASKKG
jgi:hypothetical protein